jgi:large subunit ribosomal protein L10
MKDLNRQEKETMVAELRDMLERSKATVLTHYRGLKVTEITELRHQLKEAGVEYRVVKNTLTRLAVQGTEAEELVDHLTGPSALALSYDDEMIPAKMLMDYARNNDKLQVKAGVLSGRLMLREEMIKVIALPSRDVLRAQLLGLLASLPSRLLGVMNGASRDLVSLLSAMPRDLLTVLKAIEQKSTSTS